MAIDNVKIIEVSDEMISALIADIDALAARGEVAPEHFPHKDGFVAALRRIQRGIEKKRTEWELPTVLIGSPLREKTFHQVKKDFDGLRSYFDTASKPQGEWSKSERFRMMRTGLYLEFIEQPMDAVHDAAYAIRDFADHYGPGIDRTIETGKGRIRVAIRRLFPK